jgi:DNA end-binding protein Ku
MPRAIWSGSISFGLVTIPVKLYSAVNHKDVRFNQIDQANGARVKQRRVNAETGEEVPYERIVKGYELGDGRYVTVDDSELAALDPVASRTIDLQEFVDQVDIDPVYYESPYYLAPDPVAKKAYVLLTQAMEDAGKVGIATFVMRTKKHLAALRPKDGRLVLSTMLYADEVNAADDAVSDDEIDGVEVSDAELAMANALIASLSAEFEPAKYRDDYRDAVLSLIERKAAGEEIVTAPQAPAAERVVDLMAALEASVAAAKEARKRHPTASEAEPAEQAGEEPVPQKARVRRAKSA